VACQLLIFLKNHHASAVLEGYLEKEMACGFSVKPVPEFSVGGAVVRNRVELRLI
jgi:hypothetical protein